MADTRVLQNGTDVRVLQNGTDVRVTETSVVHYTMPADAAAITETGIAAVLREAKKVLAASASAVATGIAATLRYARKMSAVAGAVALTGIAPSLAQSILMPGASGGLALTGTAATLARTRRMSAPIPPSVPADVEGDPTRTSITFSWTGGRTVNLQRQDVGLIRGRILAAAPSTIAATGIDARVFKTPPLLPAGLALATPINVQVTNPLAQGFTGSWEQGYSVTLNGQSATLSRTRIAASGQGTISIQGIDAGFTYTPRVQYTLEADSGALTLTGLSVSLSEQERINPIEGSITLSGIPATLAVGKRLHSDAGSVTLTGSAALTVQRKISAASGSLSVTGIAGRFQRSVTASLGSVTLTGQNTALVYTEVGSYDIVGAAGVFATTGLGANLTRTFNLSAGAGSVNVVTVSAALTRNLRIAGKAGAYAVTPIDAQFDRTKRLIAGMSAVVVLGLEATLQGDADAFDLVPPTEIYLDSGEIYLYLVSGESEVEFESGETFIRVEG